MDNEEWRDVTVTGDGWYVGYYQVSNWARVRSLDRVVTDINGREMRLTGKVLKQWIDNEGYPRVILCRDGEQRHVRVGWLVLEEFVGPRPPNMEMCHNSPFDRGACDLASLRWDTHAANLAEAVGVEHLTDEDVLAIRKARAAGALLQDLAEEYDRIPEAIRRICSGVYYKHVGGPRTFGRVGGGGTGRYGTL